MEPDTPTKLLNLLGTGGGLPAISRLSIIHSILELLGNLDQQTVVNLAQEMLYDILINMPDDGLIEMITILNSEDEK